MSEDDRFFREQALLEARLRSEAEDDRIARMMFGDPLAVLDEGRWMTVMSRRCKDRPDVDLHREAVRAAALALARLVVLHEAVEVRLRRPGLGYLDAAVGMLAEGRVDAMHAGCEALEASWHDDRLTREEGIEAVEAVETLRTVLRRLRACGLARLGDLADAGPEPFRAHP